MSVVLRMTTCARAGAVFTLDVLTDSDNAQTAATASIRKVLRLFILRSRISTRLYRFNSVARGVNFRRHVAFDTTCVSQSKARLHILHLFLVSMPFSFLRFA